MTETPRPAESPAAEAAVPASASEAPLEGKNDIVGVMAAVSTWVVPGWIKAATFWVSVVMIGGLVYEQIDKRATFRQLLVDSVVEPEAWRPGPAPDFSLPLGENGAPVTLSQKQGKWVLLNFWATWCAPCRDEMPSLEMLTRRLQRDHAGQIEVIAASVDDAYTEVNRFFGSTPPSFTVLWDKDKTASGLYGTRKFPETYLIAPDGTVAAKFTGPRDWYNQGMVQYFAEVMRGARKPVSS